MNSYNDIHDLTLNDLISIKGIGNVKAINILASIELGKRLNTTLIKENLKINNSNIVFKYFSTLIDKSKQEQLLVILVNNQKRLIDYKIMFKGTDTASLVSIKEILNYAIRQRANGIIIMHNHPSGNITPSLADQELTNKLIDSSKLIEIPLLDHIITNGINYYSFLEGKIINE